MLTTVLSQQENLLRARSPCHVRGQITSITEFGVFIGLPGAIEGLVHLSDLSWSTQGEEAVRKFKKGDEIEVVVLAIDVKRERISLGLKQIEPNPRLAIALETKSVAMQEPKRREAAPSEWRPQSFWTRFWGK